MIRFTLSCSRDHEFEGWFRDNATFEAQAAAGQVACPVCGDAAVRKAIMAPAVSRRGETPSLTPEQAKARYLAMRQMLTKVREHVVENFEHVGDRFADEARRIHRGEAEKRDIWGQATPTEAKELEREGVPVASLPEPPELDG